MKTLERKNFPFSKPSVSSGNLHTPTAGFRDPEEDTIDYGESVLPYQQQDRNVRRAQSSKTKKQTVVGRAAFASSTERLYQDWDAMGPIDADARAKYAQLVKQSVSGGGGGKKSQSVRIPADWGRDPESKLESSFDHAMVRRRAL